MSYQILCGDCSELLSDLTTPVDLTFLDPPFNQGKEYHNHNDSLPDHLYWQWMEEICQKVYDLTSEGGAIYFMQREKNTEYVLSCLRRSGWNLQNLIIWKKKTSAVPNVIRFGKNYQIIAFAVKGRKPKRFNRLRIDPPLPPHYKMERRNGMYVTDLWDDIRELTSGYFAGDEAIRNDKGDRFHKQQTPIQLLLRIILSSTMPGDWVLDPFAGTGTTLVAAEQLSRNSIGIEKSPENVRCIRNRLTDLREADNVNAHYKDYLYTDDLDRIWGKTIAVSMEKLKSKQPSFF